MRQIKYYIQKYTIIFNKEEVVIYNIIYLFCISIISFDFHDMNRNNKNLYIHQQRNKNKKIIKENIKSNVTAQH